MKILCITPVKHLGGVYEKLQSYGEVIYKPEVDKNELKILLDTTEVDYLFTNPNKQNFILNEEVLRDSNIKVINTCSTGLNHIDLDYCKENKIDVWSLKEDYELINDLPSTSELAFGLMMLLASDPYERITTARGVPLDELLEKSDVVFLHTHVTDETRGMVDDKFLSQMKKGSYLVNTARGELVDEKAIIESIECGHLKGYGTDVIKDEFGDIQNSKLVEFSMNPNNNVVITPHIGGMTIEGQTKAYHWAIGKFKNE